jgi:hypothetical protein
MEEGFVLDRTYGAYLQSTWGYLESFAPAS